MNYAEEHKEIIEKGYQFDPEFEEFYVPNDLLEKFEKPEGYEDWKVSPLITDSYYKERVIEELEITEKENIVDLIIDGKMEKNKIFMPNKFGDIEILCYSLNRKPYIYSKKGSQSRSTVNPDLFDVITRYNPAREKIKGRKYHITGKTNTHPFFHPILLDKFEDKEEIPTLVITEGYFKAYKATKAGIPTVGLSSITHYKDKGSDSLHPEIIDLIKVCNVKNIVILWDGDALDISTKALSEGEDIYKRPGGFYQSASTIRDLLVEYLGKRKDIYFSRIKSEALRDNPKGIDDLIVEFKEEMEAIHRDFLEIGARPGYYIDHVNITSGTKQLQKYFYLNNVERFYNFHQDKIGEREFVFYGTRYQMKEGELEIRVPAQAKNYFRIGVDFFKKQTYPDKNENMQTELSKWSKEAIVQDHGKNFLQHITKLKRFVNVPNHENYQQIIHGCYNLYHEIDHKIEQGDWPTIGKFLEHIFGEQIEYGLDYIQLLYQRPQQMLPIFCMVSRDNETGKSTFINFLQLIFKENLIGIGNDQLMDKFNAGWITKLIIACEETFIEKQQAMEKIKSYSTAETVSIRAMQKDVFKMDFFGKFIFASNNEDNFISISDKDRRFWIRKINSIPDDQKDPKMMQKFMEELPAFLEFITNRDLYVKEAKSRMYFDPKDLITEAHKKVILNSTPTVEKELRSRLRDLFLDFGSAEIKMTVKDIKNYFGLGRFEENYLNKILKDQMRIPRHTNKNGKEAVTKYSFPQWDPSGNKNVIMIGGTGRPFVFKREEFVFEDDDVEIDDFIKSKMEALEGQLS